MPLDKAIRALRGLVGNMGARQSRLHATYYKIGLSNAEMTQPVEKEQDRLTRRWSRWLRLKALGANVRSPPLTGANPRNSVGAEKVGSTRSQLAARMEPD